MKRFFAMLLVSLFAVAPLVGCGDNNGGGQSGDQHDHEHDHGHDDESPAADACEHLAESASDVTAGDQSNNPVELAEGHKTYNVTLPGTTSPKVGFGKVVSPKEAGDFYLFADKVVTFSLFQDDGTTPVAVDSTYSQTDCSTAKTSLKVKDLPKGTYILKMEAADANSPFKLVYLPAGAED